jgi:hypothetical protein
MRSPKTDARRAAEEGRVLATTAAEVAAATAKGALTGIADKHAKAAVAVAAATLERLADLGWRAVVGEGGATRRALGGDAVAERTEGFDPLATLDPRRR